MRSKILVFTVFAGAWLTAPASAQDDYDFMDDRLVVKALLGVGGTVDVGTATVFGDAEMDLEPSFGGALQYEHGLHRFFVLGVGVAMQSWITELVSDLDGNRNTLLDFDLVPKLRLPTADGRVQVYVAVPVGLTLSFPSDDALGGTIDTAIGWNIGALLGLHLGIGKAMGLVIEGGYTTYMFTHEVDLPVLPNAELDFSLQQWLMSAGVFLSF